MKYEAIQTCSREHSVRKMCSVLGLRAANYYRWKRWRKQRKKREEKERELAADNACSECFFATVTKECIYLKNYATIEEVKRDIYEYVEIFYNRKRMHSYLGYMSPVEYRLAHNAWYSRLNVPICVNQTRCHNLTALQNCLWKECNHEKDTIVYLIS